MTDQTTTKVPIPNTTSVLARRMTNVQMKFILAMDGYRLARVSRAMARQSISFIPSGEEIFIYTSQNPEGALVTMKLLRAFHQYGRPAYELTEEGRKVLEELKNRGYTL